MTNQELFNRFQELSAKIKQAGSVVQNDFNADWTDSEGINEMTKEWLKVTKGLKQELDKLLFETHVHLNSEIKRMK